jgi:hypothetical protein
MKKNSYLKPNESEQQILEGVIVRPIREEELAAYNEIIEKEHYLRNAVVVGETLRYVAEYQGTWLALLTWMAGAYHLRLREEWIGWTKVQCRKRLPLVVNNSRFLIRDGHHYPNLASRCMKLCLQRLSQDWQARYQHAVLIGESFVDPQRFRGTAYKVSGWQPVGQTWGCGRVSRDYYEAHDHPKQLWCIELQPGARQILCQDELPETLRSAEWAVPVTCRETAGQLKRIRELFSGVPEFRRGRIFYPLAGLLTLIFCAALCGLCSGQRVLAVYASELTQKQLRALGFRARDRKTRALLAPRETTFFRVLSQMAPRELEKVLLQCLEKLLGPLTAEDRLIVIDGKALKSSQGVQLVSAFSVRHGRWLGTEIIEEKSNEIPAAQALLARIPLEQAIVLPDALHTQDENARRIVMDYGADYFMTVKGNQAGVKKMLEQMLERRPTGAFSPSDRSDHGRV